MISLDGQREKFRFSPSGKSVVRQVVFTNGENVSTWLKVGSLSLDGQDAKSAFDYLFLRKRDFPNQSHTSPVVRVVDLFSGCGGLSLGAMEACRAIGKRFLSVAAIDSDSTALDVYRRNIPCVQTYCKDIETILTLDSGSEISRSERKIHEEIGKVNILLSGSPCQGYSDLNNYTRRKDPRNCLYEYVARFVEIARPDHVLVENVPAVIHGKERVVQKTINRISEAGYYLDDDIVNMAEIGVPQLRKRHVLVASLSRKMSIKRIIKRYSIENPRCVTWGIDDLKDEPAVNSFSTPTRHTEVSMKRIRYLFENDLYDLPDRFRPKCHENGDHSYKSMYGRMRPDQPSQTITGGFGSPGQGRFVHPTRQRTITPHEAARLQFFPEFFDFSFVQKRTSLANIIGNATPMKLSYIFCLEMLA